MRTGEGKYVKGSVSQGSEERRSREGRFQGGGEM